MPSRRYLFAIVLICGVVLLAHAQETDSPDIMVPESGNYLVDAEGMSVYIYLEDEPGVSNCYGACAENWPPLAVEGDPVAGSGVDGQLLGVLERDDGVAQLTYAGRPLYYFSRDKSPGDMGGHKLGRAFYLVSPSGEQVDEPTAATQAQGGQVEEATAAALMTQGESIFRNVCAACHGADGQGGMGPRLDGHPNVGRKGFVVRTVLLGRPEHGMPSFADTFTDQEIAAVATFVKNAWSNDHGPVSAEEVSNLR